MLPTVAMAPDSPTAPRTEDRSAVTPPPNVSYAPGMITFEDPRQIAAETLSARSCYTVEIKPWGFEDAEAYLVVEHHEPGFVPMGAPVVLVSKLDGALNLVPYLADADRFHAMARVGAPEPSTV